MRLRPNANIFDAVTKIEAQWKKLKPDEPFTYRFVDDIVDGYYKKEVNLLSIFELFSAICVLIACMGLFGLSTFMISVRTKEIGIRKVLGAGFLQLIKLLFKPFTQLVLLALIIGIPVTWYTLEHFWLNNFAYRIEIDVWTLVLISACMILLTWLVISQDH